MPLFNFDTWKNIDLIFPEGGTYLNNRWMSNEEIQSSGLPSIHSPITIPIRQGIDSEIKITWYDNGDMDRVTVYNTYPPVLVDNIPPLNIYAQKIYNQLILNLNNQNNSEEEKNYTYDLKSDYSSL